MLVNHEEKRVMRGHVSFTPQEDIQRIFNANSEHNQVAQYKKER